MNFEDILRNEIMKIVEIRGFLCGMKAKNEFFDCIFECFGENSIKNSERFLDLS